MDLYNENNEEEIKRSREKAEQFFNNKKVEPDDLKKRLSELKNSIHDEPTIEINKNENEVSPHISSHVAGFEDAEDGDDIVEIKNTMAVFLQAYHENGYNVVRACQQSGVGRATYYGWLKHNPEFVAALNEFENNLTVAALECIYNAIKGGDARIALATMKSISPKFKDKIDITSNGNTIGTVIQFITPTDKHE